MSRKRRAPSSATPQIQAPSEWLQDLSQKDWDEIFEKKFTETALPIFRVAEVLKELLHPVPRKLGEKLAPEVSTIRDFSCAFAAHGSTISPKLCADLLPTIGTYTIATLTNAARGAKRAAPSSSARASFVIAWSLPKLSLPLCQAARLLVRRLATRLRQGERTISGQTDCGTFQIAYHPETQLQSNADQSASDLRKKYHGDTALHQSLIPDTPQKWQHRLAQLLPVTKDMIDTLSLREILDTRPRQLVALLLRAEEELGKVSVQWKQDLLKTAGSPKRKGSRTSKAKQSKKETAKNLAFTYQLIETAYTQLAPNIPRTFFTAIVARGMCQYQKIGGALPDRGLLQFKGVVHPDFSLSMVQDSLAAIHVLLSRVPELSDGQSASTPDSFKEFSCTITRRSKTEHKRSKS